MRVSELQASRNADTRDAWESFASHRDRVTELLRVVMPNKSSSLCVLGAGNCNDLDLREVLNLYRDLHLLDLDGRALEAGIERQSVDRKRLRIVADFDATGVAPLLSQWDPGMPANDAELEACLVATNTLPKLPDGPFDVVLSACLLSQLIDGIGHTLGEQHPRFLELLMALRLQHLRLLMEAVRPAGTAVLMTDIVSSSTCPEMLQVAEGDLPRVISSAINSRNFFTGVNPMVLAKLFSDESSLASSVATLSITKPWLWDLGPRVYAVCAIVVKKR